MAVSSLLFAAAGVIVTGFFLLCGVTLGLAVWKRRSDKHRKKIRDRLREELFDRRNHSNPEWDAWVASLSDREQAELETLLKEYLRVIEGSSREVYLQIADALDVGAEAQSIAGQTDAARLHRLKALATLAVVDHPVSIAELRDACQDTQRLREAGARLICECTDEYDRPAEHGTELLIGEGQEPLTVYGLDTLMELNDGVETPVLTLAQAQASSWLDAVVVQVCTVLEHTQAPDPDAPFGWLAPLWRDDDPEVRAAAVRAVKRQGWRDTLRARIDIDTLVTDPSPRVRRATYEVLAVWGDASARESLKQAAMAETDPRSQLAAVRALVSLNADPPTNHPGWPDGAWNWVTADMALRAHSRPGLPPQEDAS